MNTNVKVIAIVSVHLRHLAFTTCSLTYTEAVAKHFPLCIVGSPIENS